ncbi:unnamed protein product [Linum trigynum]|uniref:Gnk2-homologous domain-containing protein n=1 Tax=Linum trigynum TaxID=586398 RepID=A0AAV2CLA6_9ROSI
MGVQVGRSEARMATVLISSLILTTINGGFHGDVMIIFSAEAALDPLCSASHEWFCSPTNTSFPSVQRKIFLKLKSPIACDRFYSSSSTVPDAYVHYSCADAHDPKCGDCLTTATRLMRFNCIGKDGAQYGTEQCCVRYEKEKFC